MVELYQYRQGNIVYTMANRSAHSTSLRIQGMQTLYARQMQYSCAQWAHKAKVAYPISLTTQTPLRRP